MSRAPIIFGQGTDYDISARTVFRGDDQRMILQTGSRYPEDRFGVTTMTRRWRCRRDRYEALKPIFGDYDFLFPALRVTDVDPTDDGAMTTVTVQYNGFIDGVPRGNVIERENLQWKEATLYANDGSGSLTLVYQCPTLTREYASDRIPKLLNPHEYPQFHPAIPPTYYFRNANGIELRGATRADTVALLGLFTYSVKSLRTQFDPSPDGHIYRITEVIERQIVQQAIAELGLLEGLAR